MIPLFAWNCLNFSAIGTNSIGIQTHASLKKNQLQNLVVQGVELLQV
jgi:hypothetical protein